MFDWVSFRRLQALVFVLCAGLLAAAYYFEYVLYLEPCPLCIMQRIATLLIGLTALIAAIQGPASETAKRVYAAFGLLSAGLGVAVAARHVWIQNLPLDQVPACGPSLEYMLQAFPWMEALSLMLKGDGSCADQAWSFLTLTMPEWTLIWFVGFSVFSLSQLIKPWPRTQSL
jgi:disulfide bond formation protein DsbB